MSRKLTLPALTISIPSESEEQAVVCQYLNSKNIPYFSNPNAAKRDYKLAQWYKNQGMKAGVPDLFITVPKKLYHGLFIEMKRQRGGVISLAQHYWIKKLREYGYAVYIAKGAQSAIDYINHYMGANKN